MTTIAVVMATALLLAVSVMTVISAVRTAEEVGGRVVVAAVPGNGLWCVLSRALAAAAFLLVATMLWHSSEPAAAFADWLEAALPAWLDWLI